MCGSWWSGQHAAAGWGHSLGTSWPWSVLQELQVVCEEVGKAFLVKESLRALVGLAFQQYWELILEPLLEGAPFRVG